MLTVAALGMFAYGTYSAGWAAVDLVRGARLELWAELAQIGFGALTMLSAAFVRVRLPGGLAAAGGGMLGLQALAVHSAAHFGTGLTPQLIRAAIGASLLALAAAARAEPARDP